MARSITGTYTAGLTITSAGDNPLGIASGANIGNASGIALQSALPVYWSVSNAGGANISGYTFGVSLTNGGVFNNSGQITASYSGGSGFSYSTVTHGFTVLSAALFQGGGRVSNSAGGVISGGVEGVALGGAVRSSTRAALARRSPGQASASPFPPVERSRTRRAD